MRLSSTVKYLSNKLGMQASSGLSGSTADFLKILSERDARVRARAEGSDLLALSLADVADRLFELQSTRVRLYKAWDVALTRAVRAKAEAARFIPTLSSAASSSSSSTDSNHADAPARASAEARAAVCMMEYQEIARDLTGAFNAVSQDVIRVRRELARRASEEQEAGAAATDEGQYAVLAAAVTALQKKEAEKLALTVRLHQLRWNLDAGQPAEMEAAQEDLGGVIDAINELLRETKILVLNDGTNDNEIPRP